MNSMEQAQRKINIILGYGNHSHAETLAFKLALQAIADAERCSTSHMGGICERCAPVRRLVEELCK